MTLIAKLMADRDKHLKAYREACNEIKKLRNTAPQDEVPIVVLFKEHGRTRNKGFVSGHRKPSYKHGSGGWHRPRFYADDGKTYDWGKVVSWKYK